MLFSFTVNLYVASAGVAPGENDSRGQSILGVQGAAIPGMGPEGRALWWGWGQSPVKLTPF